MKRSSRRPQQSRSRSPRVPYSATMKVRRVSLCLSRRSAWRSARHQQLRPAGSLHRSQHFFHRPAVVTAAADLPMLGGHEDRFAGNRRGRSTGGFPAVPEKRRPQDLVGRRGRRFGDPALAGPGQAVPAQPVQRQLRACSHEAARRQQFRQRDVGHPPFLGSIVSTRPSVVRSTEVMARASVGNLAAASRSRLLRINQHLRSCPLRSPWTLPKCPLQDRGHSGTVQAAHGGGLRFYGVRRGQSLTPNNRIFQTRDDAEK